MPDLLRAPEQGTAQGAPAAPAAVQTPSPEPPERSSPQEAEPSPGPLRTSPCMDPAGSHVLWEQSAPAAPAASSPEHPQSRRARHRLRAAAAGSPGSPIASPPQPCRGDVLGPGGWAEQQQQAELLQDWGTLWGSPLHCPPVLTGRVWGPSCRARGARHNPARFGYLQRGLPSAPLAGGSWIT